MSVANKIRADNRLCARRCEQGFDRKEVEEEP